MHWERIEPVAESFGDLDPRMDLRQADLQAGQEWTGWHRIEIGNDAKGLLDEVATSKVTGEEEAWSHTDLWDVQANVAGARVAYHELQALLDRYRDGDGFVPYTELGRAEVKQLSDAVNALSEPLARLTGGDPLRMPEEQHGLSRRRVFGLAGAGAAVGAAGFAGGLETARATGGPRRSR